MNAWRWFGLAAAVVLALWSLSWGLLWWQPTSIGAGPFGDTFGAVNALFSGLAFAGIIVALFLQRRDLQMQRDTLELQMEEIRLQREELKGSREAQEAQAELLHIAAELNARTAIIQSAGRSITGNTDLQEHLTRIEEILGILSQRAD